MIGGVAGLVVAVQAARQDSDGGYLEPFFDVAAWIIGTAVGAGVGNIVGFVIGASTGGFICGGVGAMVDPARPEENQAPPPAPAPAPAGQSASTAAAPLRF